VNLPELAKVNGPTTISKSVERQTIPAGSQLPMPPETW
jgi:hypothetical protein